MGGMQFPSDLRAALSAGEQLPPIRYEERIVALMDVLGFRALVANTETDTDLARDTIGRIAETSRPEPANTP
jgi:hypothetical protein